MIPWKYRDTQDFIMTKHMLCNLLLRIIFSFILGMPSYDDIIDNSYVKDTKLLLNVTLMNVHPLPNCSLQYNAIIPFHIK